MDPTDMRIFCEIGFKYLDYRAPTERRVSPTDIGLKLGLDEKTVRLRVQKMEDDGFIKYYQAIPNLGLFGLGTLGGYGFEAADLPTKQTAIKSLGERPGVVEVIDSLGPYLGARFAGASVDQVHRQAVQFADALGLKRVFKVSDRRLAEPTVVPGRLDWQIILACRYDALCSPSDLALKLSITPRMAEYRIGKLLEARAFFIKAVLDAQHLRGAIFYQLVLLVDDAAKATVVQELQRLHGERMWYVEGPTSLKTVLIPRRLSDRFLMMLAGNSWAVSAQMFGETTAEPEAALSRSLKLTGVKRGFFGVIKEWIEPPRPNWIDDLIQAKIGSLAS